MTSCHHNHRLGYRLTTEHLPSCPNPETCTGCRPCPEHHCTVCARNHTLDHELTCPACIAKTRADLADITVNAALLTTEALEGARDGRLVAAAPIPGGTAQVLIGPTVRLDVLRVSREMSHDHHPDDPIPPLAVLAQWEDLWRRWLNHAPARRATLTNAVDYLALQLDYMAQQFDGPSYPDFARQVRTIRARLERALHDERTPERGVACFECDGQLVRRFHRRQFCCHDTAARTWFKQALTLRALGYPELGPTPPETRAALRPCGECDQGGIENPTAGQSWECLDCGKEYDPGEYANAVRSDLLTSGPDGDGWTHITMAAEAASTLVGEPVSAGTVRKWVDRGKAASKLAGPLRLVFWPDVADAALAMKRRRAEQALIVPRTPGERDGQRNSDGARWCVTHQRWECGQTKKLASGDGRRKCHGNALLGSGLCRVHGAASTPAATRAS